MEDQLTNQLDMIGTTLTVAKSSDHRAVWQGKDPTDFGTDLATLETGYGAAAALAAQLATVGTGPADAKDTAETALEQITFKLCRSLAVHFKKTADLTSRAQVAVRIGAIQKLRDQALIDFASAVRQLATTASADPAAAARGVTAARISTLTAALHNFENLKNTPRGTIVNRVTLRNELKTDIAGLLEALTDLDDLVIQFDETEAAHRFVAAWKQARQIIDAGHRYEEGPGANPPTTPPPAPPKP